MDNNGKEIKRNSFVFYRSFVDFIAELQTTEEKLKAFQIVTEYALNGERPTALQGALKMFWIAVEPILTANWKKSMNFKIPPNGERKRGGQYGNTNACKTSAEYIADAEQRAIEKSMQLIAAAKRQREKDLF